VLPRAVGIHRLSRNLRGFRAPQSPRVALTASSVKAASEQPLVIPVSRLAPYGAREPLRVEEGGEVPRGQVFFFFGPPGIVVFGV